MDQASLLHDVVLAIGGAVGANILGALVRGGGGVIGRTLLGVLGGLAGGFAVDNVAQLGHLAEFWSNLMPDNPENSGRAADLITGAAGGGVVGLIAGLIIRPRI